MGRTRGGIVFFECESLSWTEDFYTKKVGCQLWLDQKNCLIFRFGNMLFGFCRRKQSAASGNDGLLTFVLKNKKEVDAYYQRLRDCAEDQPKESKKFIIYNFFARDPENRRIEFQTFLQPVKIP